MNAAIIKADWTEANKKYREYAQAVKHRREPYLKTLKTCYSHLRQRRGVLDLYESLKLAGANDLKEPRLAIAKADWPEVRFHFNYSQQLIFDNWPERKAEIKIPETIFEKDYFTHQ